VSAIASGPAPARAALAPRSSPIGVSLIAGTVLASGVASYDASVVNVAVPAIGRRFDAGVALIARLFVSDEPAATPRIAAPDRGCALPVLDAKEKP
jgi:hypothetical protein